MTEEQIRVTPNPTPNPIPNTTVKVRRTISPYDLTSAKNPGEVISHPLLKGNNSDEWACSMKMALRSRKKFGFLDGTIPQPDAGSPGLEDWWTIQALLVSWIKMSIDPTVKYNVSHRDVAKDLWDHLKKRFSVMNGPKLQQLKSGLIGCKQRGLTIENYYGKLTKLWGSIASFRPVRVCKCGQCVCDLGVLQEKDREEDKVHEFLSGLDDVMFCTVRSSIVSRVPVPSLEKVYNIVRQEEDLIGTGVKTTYQHSEVQAFAALMKTRPNQGRNDEINVVCKHCNRSGHSSDSCYAVIGYPEFWGDRPRSKSLKGRGRGRVVSGGGRERGAAAYTNSVRQPTCENHTQAHYVVTDKDKDGISGLTEKQWNSIKHILNANTELQQKS